MVIRGIPWMCGYHIDSVTITDNRSSITEKSISETVLLTELKLIFCRGYYLLSVHCQGGNSEGFDSVYQGYGLWNDSTKHNAHLSR